MQAPSDENEWAYQHGRATELAYTFRKKQVDTNQLNEILSYEKANQWANEIEEKQKENLLPNDNMPVSWTSVDGHTTHLTTADQWGMLFL